MWENVPVPLWLLVLTGLLAILALIDRLLVPSVRWALRRRANRAIEELNTRLKIRIRPFKVTRRKTLIDSLLYDPKVMHAVENYAAEKDVPRDVAVRVARGYAKEIVPSFSTYTYFGVGARLAKRLSKMLYRVRLGYANDEALRQVDPDASVVFVINHRSNLDYVLVTYIAASSSALSYAVGEWANTWPLNSLFRSMGAYFIRRDSTGNTLYRRILARYVHNATQSGVVQAVFPEGGLSRDGALRPPKLGLLNYMVSGFDPEGERDVVFIPVGVNYDRVLEDRMLTHAIGAAGKGSAPFRFKPFVLVKFLLNAAWLSLRGRWHRYGYACVSFGQPISLRKYVSDHGLNFQGMHDAQKAAEMERLGTMLMTAVGDVVPALPVALVASVVLANGDKPLTRFELMASVSKLIERLEARGAYTHIPRHDREYAIDVGLRMLLLRKLLHEKNGVYHVNTDDIVLLRYYANSIAHLVAPTEVV